MTAAGRACATRYATSRRRCVGDGRSRRTCARAAGCCWAGARGDQDRAASRFEENAISPDPRVAVVVISHRRRAELLVHWAGHASCARGRTSWSSTMGRPTPPQSRPGALPEGGAGREPQEPQRGRPQSGCCSREYPIWLQHPYTCWAGATFHDGRISGPATVSVSKTTASCARLAEAAHLPHMPPSPSGGLTLSSDRHHRGVRPCDCGGRRG